MAVTVTMLAAVTPGPAVARQPDGPAARLAAGGSHTCALDGNGRISCWGQGGFGQLGNSSDADRSRPVAVNAPAGETFTHLAAGGNHTCGLARNTGVYCWGSGRHGALGYGGVVNQTRPVTVNAPAGVTLTQLTAGGDHTCGLGSDTRTYCWGNGEYGQLGNADLVEQLTPGAVSAPAGVTLTHLAAGDDHMCGLGSDTGTYCWGNGVYGQLGNGGEVNQLRPVAVDAPAGVIFTQLTAGTFHTCGISSDTSVYCWDEGRFGALGDGGTVDRTRPVAVRTPAGVTLTQLTAGRNHTCGLGGDVKVYCWGEGRFGALGDGGGTDQSTTPVAVIAPG
ncbi:hypothetical protein AB0G04_43990 [Actinoplanes sp. NPDC023801]|uniref:RCC1 domain-containing protein n=1 Tax=Actinoplanes sp. NPDC023801 TaxID=3154595 RepID=UPI0033CB5460